MKAVFKKYFVPHEGNEHKPHLLRRKALFALALTAFAFELVFLLESTSYPFNKFFAEVLPSVLVDLTNENRAYAELPRLTRSPILDRSAARKAAHMAEHGYFAHTSPDGVTPWHWFEEAGYEFVHAGENLAVNFVDSEDVVSAWMASPSHKANILSHDFAETGMATARGTYKGRDALFVVQHFGVPRAHSALGVANADAPPQTPKEEEFVVTENDTSIVLSVKSAEDGLGIARVVGSVPVEHESTLLQRIAVHPRALVAYVLYAMLLAVTVALLIKLSHWSKFHHPELIAHSVLFLVIIGSAVFINSGISLLYEGIL